MSYDRIQAALETRMTQLVNSPKVVFENVKYEPTTNVPYLRTRFMPIDRRPASCGIGSDLKPYMQYYYGLFQVVLNFPESQGSRATNIMVAELIDKFEAATDLSFDGVYVTIKQIERMRGINDGPWFKTPVNIYWHSYSK